MLLAVQSFVFLSLLTFINSSDICDSYDTYLDIFEDQAVCEQHEFACVSPEHAKRVYIFGASGVGKSTFINVMTGNFIQTDECFASGTKFSYTAENVYFVDPFSCHLFCRFLCKFRR